MSMMSTRFYILGCIHLAVLAIIFAAGACSSNQNRLSMPSKDAGGLGVQANNSRNHSIEKRIIEQYHRWEGTRHKMGGTGSKGIDCSAFVKAIYRDAFNIDLPRTTKAQARLGKPMAFNALQPGDLVFFKPPTYARHVGIFLSRSEFVHASKNKGVTISSIDAPYWKKYFWTARRILPDN
jgi:cell wall-associated NlpC family hydrolase